MSNCLIFALNRWFKKGGYLIIRRSRIGFWWHFLWAKDLEGLQSLEHYVPVEDELKVEVASKVFFEGKIKTEDT
jgi:hypothetical protein